MRRPIITREITTTVAVVLTVNATTHEVGTVEITLPTVYDNSEKAMNYIRKHYTPEAGQVYAAVTELKQVSTMLGMWLEDFVSHAFQLDPTTRKPIGVDDGTDEDEDE